MNKKNKSEADNRITNLLFFISAVTLFVLANPNPVFKKGLGFIAWIYYVPVLFLIEKQNLNKVILSGFLYALVGYGIYAYWLLNSYILGYFVVIIAYGILYSILFSLLKALTKLFKNNAWIIQCLLIAVFEYVKTLGFLGFNYGVTAYTQWRYPLVIQICNLTGVFGLNLLLIMTSGVIFALINKKYLQKQYVYKNINTKSNIKRFLQEEELKQTVSLKTPLIVLIILGFFYIFILIYGIICLNTNNTDKSIKVCAIQSNESPWEDGIEAYARNVNKLMKLTDEALEIAPDIQIMIWPETAVVPAIVYNFDKAKDERRKQLSYDILNYINNKKCQFIIGNGHKIINSNGMAELYNSTLVFNPGENTIPPKPEIYSKHHLVPFTEYFPYAKAFPGIYKFLISKGHQMWIPGKNYTVFEKDGFKYSTPICFEDTFSEICRRMRKNGANGFINLSNDSWSKSQVCQNQHLALAVFRCVENRVPAVRCTTSGQTCIINSRGQIEKTISGFVSTYLVGQIEVISSAKNTVFSVIGDSFGMLEAVILCFVLIIQLILVNIKKHKKLGNINGR